MTEVAFLGLGAMGQRMAARLIHAGHQVRVWNRTPGRAASLEAAGARVAASPREAAQGAAFVIAMLRDDEASRAVWLDAERGAALGLGSDTIAIESSTLSRAWVHELSAALAGRAAGFLDAPVVGSRPQAEAGQLVHLVGGEQTVFERARPLLAAMAAAVHHVGASGQGGALKLAVNALFATQVAALAELLALLRHGGGEMSRIVEVIGALAVTSPAAKGAAASILNRQFAPLFPAELAEKDLRYLLAADAGGGLPVSTAVHGVLLEACRKGFGSEHLTGVARLFDPG